MIKLLIMDVDGTLTDGTINIGDNGELFKSFNAKDGYGINVILPQNGIKTAVITGRKSAIVERRAKELNIDFVYQGVDNKTAILSKILHELKIDYSSCAYIGDDMNDFECMSLCAERGCPADADTGIKAICTYVCKNNGGKGAVREFIEYLCKMSDG